MFTGCSLPHTAVGCLRNLEAGGRAQTVPVQVWSRPAPRGCSKLPPLASPSVGRQRVLSSDRPAGFESLGVPEALPLLIKKGSPRLRRLRAETSVHQKWRAAHTPGLPSVGQAWRFLVNLCPAVLLPCHRHRVPLVSSAFQVTSHSCLPGTLQEGRTPFLHQSTGKECLPFTRLALVIISKATGVVGIRSFRKPSRRAGRLPCVLGPSWEAVRQQRGRCPVQTRRPGGRLSAHLERLPGAHTAARGPVSDRGSRAPCLASRCLFSCFLVFINRLEHEADASRGDLQTACRSCESPRSRLTLHGTAPSLLRRWRAGGAQPAAAGGLEPSHTLWTVMTSLRV